MTKSRPQDKLFNYLTQNLKVARPVKNISIDFAKPWWQIFTNLKFLLFNISIFVIVQRGFWASLPILIGYIFSIQKFEYFIWVILFWVFIQIWIFFLNPHWIRLYSIVALAFRYNSQKFFLTSDPINHVLRDSGQILGKTQRAASGYDNLLGVITEDLWPTFVQIFTGFLGLFFIDPRLGWLGMVFFGLFSFQSVFYILKIETWIEPKVIQSEDELKRIELENLTQVSLIRSSFATQNQLAKSLASIQKSYSLWNLKWRVQYFLDFAVNISYIIACSLIGYLIISKIQDGSLSSTLALGVITSFLAFSSEVLWIGFKFQRLAKSVVDIQDFYKFVNSFGVQTYPVLTKDTFSRFISNI